MPIYEFICESCSNEFEKIVSFSATSTPACPSCSSNSVRRRLSKPAIHFKGSGWYITDSKASNGANGSAKTSGDKGSSEQAQTTNGHSDASSTESKSATTTSEPTKSKSAETTGATASA